MDGKEALKSWQQLLKRYKDSLGDCWRLHGGQELLFRTARGPSAERRAPAALLAAISISCCTQMEPADEFVGMKKLISD